MKIIALYLTFFLYQFGFSHITNLEKSMQKAQMYFGLPQDSLVFHTNFIIKNSKNESDKGLAYHYLGNIYKINGNLELALKNYKIENIIFKKLLEKSNSNIDLKNNYANSIASMAIIISNQFNLFTSFKLSFQSKKIYSETNNLKKLAAVSNNIAIEYQSLNKIEIANNYFNDAIKFNKENTISNELLYTNIAKIRLKSIT